mmetsp:Transcript_11202/g.69166  ORF Transcript_11202/g.69166 Transcript_11202/m.69166 type:complete len:202 (+) Transcript_11202:3187-3792(+)
MQHLHSLCAVSIPSFTVDTACSKSDCVWVLHSFKILSSLVMFQMGTSLPDAMAATNSSKLLACWRARKTPCSSFSLSIVDAISWSISLPSSISSSPSDLVFVVPSEFPLTPNAFMNLVTSGALGRFVIFTSVNLERTSSFTPTAFPRTLAALRVFPTVTMMLRRSRKVLLECTFLQPAMTHSKPPKMSSVKESNCPIKTRA